MADRTVDLQKIYDDSAAPGADAFRRIVAKKGLKLTAVEAKALVASLSQGQVFQGRLESDGRITASRPNEIFQVDLIDYTKKSAEGSRYILAVVDVFSRKLWVEPLASKDPGSVVVALRKVFLRSLYPEQITTDMGQEFLGKPVASYLQEAGIVHVTKDPAAVNTLAVVDRAIGKYKSILRNLLTKQGGTWSTYVQKAADVFNDLSLIHI